ncbi:hypothetical protein GC170_17615 [bacterium]|nr:hypothetical protein [bacterium]
MMNMNAADENRQEAFDDWSRLRQGLIRIGLDRPWPESLIWIGVFHLTACIVCHILYRYVTIAPLPYLATWSAQLAANILMLRKLHGRGWSRSHPLIGVLTRVWLTFLIISFSVTSYSEMSAAQANAFNWFKPAWASLSCFAWAMTAWIVSPWFVVAAVWTWATGWAMIYRIHDAYLIYGIGWATLLWVVAAILIRKRKRQAGQFEKRVE